MSQSIFPYSFKLLYRQFCNDTDGVIITMYRELIQQKFWKANVL